MSLRADGIGWAESHGWHAGLDRISVCLLWRDKNPKIDPPQHLVIASVNCSDGSETIHSPGLRVTTSPRDVVLCLSQSRCNEKQELSNLRWSTSNTQWTDRGAAQIWSHSLSRGFAWRLSLTTVCYCNYRFHPLGFTEKVSALFVPPWCEPDLNKVKMSTILSWCRKRLFCFTLPPLEKSEDKLQKYNLSDLWLFSCRDWLLTTS